jgi:hypothetical protein
MKAKVLKITLVVVIVSAFFAAPVLAVENYVGGIRCSALKTISTTWETTWTGTIYSVADQPIGTIGWTWWTTRETCNGTIYHQDVHAARASYGDDREVDAHTDDFYCGAAPHKVYVLGKHQFKEGTDSWYPEFTVYRTEP